MATGCDEVHEPLHAHRFYEIEVREEGHSNRCSSAPIPMCMGGEGGRGTSIPMGQARDLPARESVLFEAKKKYEKSKVAIAALVAAGSMSEAEASKVYT